RLPRLLLELLDALPLHVDDVAQALGDVVIDTAEVVALELVPATPAQSLEQLPHAGDAFLVVVAEPRLHEAAEGGVEVAVVEQVIGDLREDVVGRQLEADLRPVPAGVLEANRHRWSVGAPGTIGSMPEGHTIHRLARDHSRALGRQPVEVTSPQGRFAES